VVSWNEAAESQDSVAKEALVIPINSGRPSGTLATFNHGPVGVPEGLGVGSLTGQEVGFTSFLHAHAASHLTNNQFDVLVVNSYTLVAINPLHFFDQVLLSFTNALDLHQFFWI